MDYTYLDTLQDEVDTLLAKINKVLSKSPKQRSADTAVDDTWSQAGDTPDEEAALDPDDYEEFDDDGDEEEDDDDEDTVLKASLTYAQTENDGTNRPGTLASSTLPQPRHKFEALVDKVKNEQGIPKSEAMAFARQRFPAIYQSYQAHVAGNIGKSAPTFESLVAAEIKKSGGYMSEELAGQRVLQQFGSAALRHRALAKRAAEALDDSFAKRAETLWLDSSLDRCEALRETRKRNPKLFKALQGV